VRAFALALAAVVLVPASAGARKPLRPKGSWKQVAVQRFSGLDAELRSQGVASDGRSLFFSYQLGLMRTALGDPSVLQAVWPYAIPLDLVLAGSNHIGDIDVYGGKVYAPVEDGDGYKRPYIVLYDAKTLQPTGERHLLPRALLTEGVPWVAVDAARGYAYTAEWNDTKVLNVFSLRDFHLVKTVKLSMKLGRIQGAKMLDGLLYAAEDNGDLKSIYAIDPARGAVTKVMDRRLPAGTEAEGLAFTQSPGGTLMHTLEVEPSGLSVLYRTFLQLGRSGRSPGR
jgi:hypothetical protein